MAGERTGSACRTALALATGLSALAASGGAARGDYINYEFSGVVTTSAASGVPAGTQFTGTFAFDYSEKPSLVGSYEGSNAYYFGKVSTQSPPVQDASNLTLSLGSGQSYGNPGGIVVGITQSQYAGQYGYAKGPSTFASVGSDLFQHGALEVALSFTNETRAVYGSLAPPSSFHLADFQTSKLSVTSRGPGGASVLYEGQVTSLAAVPEPSGSFLFAFGLVLGLAQLGRGRRRAIKLS